MEDKGLLTIEEVARLLGVPKQTLASWRYQGVGPAFIKLGPRTVRYTAGDLERWIDKQRTQQTGQAPALAGPLS